MTVKTWKCAALVRWLKPSCPKELILQLRGQTDTPNQGSNRDCRLNAHSGSDSTRPFCLLSSFPLSEDRLVYIFYQKIEVFLSIGDNDYDKSCQIEGLFVPGASYALSLILTQILQGRWFRTLPASFVFFQMTHLSLKNVKQLAQSRCTTFKNQAEILSLRCSDRMLEEK